MSNIIHIKSEPEDSSIIFIKEEEISNPNFSSSSSTNVKNELIEVDSDSDSVQLARGRLSTKWTKQEEKILLDAWKLNPPNFSNLTLDLPNRDRRNIKRKFDKMVATIYNHFNLE
ncbi:3403_t:CDS:2 [Ambispora gerdemannii]|uniref:3403_t:CDS:1 n=1 Tax=Ambispora gerdemannii TaxID=144530 RepID=A0A9N8VFD7_9GLOM|nr:3403_t:CDS:2 [Ambispora gerdemannii]